MKRLFDIMLSSAGLLLLFPFFIIIGLLIVFEDKGPVFFRQPRAGKGGKLFVLFKFRSMKVPENAGQGNFEPGDTSRVTSVGRLLRRSKVDELPQLINVFKGDMSFVGPRPEVPKWVDEYPERWEKVLSVRPGITDNASVLFRSEESLLAGSDDPEKTYREVLLPRKLDLYEEYVDNNSFLGDIILIFKTLYSVILK